MLKRIFINNQIRADKVRLIDQDGKQLGIFGINEALQKAREARLDLIKVTDKVEPPVCRIMDYGKYAYQQKKKERKQHQKGGELKSIRLTFNISPHDLATRAAAAEKFLKKGNKVRLELVLRGREKSYGLRNFAEAKLKQLLEILQKSMSIKVERVLKQESRGLTMIITKQ